MFAFPYQKIGFTFEEWTRIPNAVKRNIRDYYLCKKDRDATVKFAFFETDFAVRRAEKTHRLPLRPNLVFHAEDFSFL